MYQIGLKLYSSNTDKYLYEAEKLYAKKCFSYIELYVLPNSLGFLSKWKTLSIPYVIHCAHCAHGFNLALSNATQSNRNIYDEAKIYADELNSPYIIFHGGCGGSIEETVCQLSSFNEPRALIENKPLKPLNDITKYHCCRGYSIRELSFVIQTIGCGFCLDFGHAVCAANSLKIDPYEYIIEMMKLRPAMFHLSGVENISSQTDAHPHLTDSVLKMEKFIHLLPENAKITIETNKNSKENLADFVDDCRFLKTYDLKCTNVTMADAKLIFDLSNEPLVRKNSFSSEEINWSSHVEWLQKKISTANLYYYIIRNQLNDFVGQVRFEPISHRCYLVSFSITSDFRGKHLSSYILKYAIEILQKSIGKVKLIATIKNDNFASLRCFYKVGFLAKNILSETTELEYEQK